MRRHIIFCCFAGLVAAKTPAIQPRQDPSNIKGVTGNICCNHGTTDPNKLCSNATLNAYCVSFCHKCYFIYNDRKDQRGEGGGCDPFPAFDIGRSVTLVDPTPGLNCKSGEDHDNPGFVGCAK
ncbi:hypothetical protein PspLS_09774 [Pyricularia sp. CBS 133598]|nr:hypothetical protein PspLS_09774 [Pyricularia sp. CBS 133598]